MGYMRICDLCGEPLRSIGRTFKIKERKHSFHESWWTEIECHDECVKSLMKAVKEEQCSQES